MILPNQIKNHQSLRIHKIERTKERLEKLYKDKEQINKKDFITKLMSDLITTDRTAKEYLKVALCQLNIGEEVVFK